MRIIINWALKTLTILGLNWLGWLYLLDGHGGRVSGLTQTSVTSAAIVALIFTIIAVVLILVSFGLAVLLFIFLGGAILGLTEHFASGYIGTPGFWWTVLCGFIILLVQLPSRSRSEHRN